MDTGKRRFTPATIATPSQAPAPTAMAQPAGKTPETPFSELRHTGTPRRR
jgi:hypothetical protein